MLKKNKTTPQNVKEAHEALFHAKMNLPNAADHCGMTQKELKMTFFGCQMTSRIIFQIQSKKI